MWNKRVLTIDVGNTTADLCLFEGEFKPLGKFSHFELPKVDADLVLLSSVKPSVETYMKSLYPKARFIKPQKVPIEASFPHKEKVGIDRLINLYGALNLYGKDLIVVSAGTALVIDLLVDGIFQGGFITIGIGTGIDCLSKRAELIPPIKLKDIRVDIGRNTEEALLGGSIKKAFYFVLGCLKDWEESYKRSLKVIITGGDGYILRDLGIYDPLLIHKGMLALAEKIP
ncbi:MAG: type III pantothenate kinase [Aquificaceae bacterium]